jgi:hypothetical protein
MCRFYRVSAILLISVELGAGTLQSPKSNDMLPHLALLIVTTSIFIAILSAIFTSTRLELRDIAANLCNIFSGNGTRTVSNIPDE